MSDEEILRLVNEQWSTKFDHERITASVEMNTPSRIRVRVHRMYSPPGLTFAQLEGLAAAFGTKNIDAGDTFADGGCETCDYGSEYGFVLDIRLPAVNA